MQEETKELDEIQSFLASRDSELHVSYQGVYDRAISKLLFHADTERRPMVLFVPGMMGSCLKKAPLRDNEGPYWINFDIIRAADRVSEGMRLRPEQVQVKPEEVKDPGHWRNWLWTEPQEPPGLVADGVVDLSVNLLLFDWHITSPYHRMVDKDEIGAIPFSYDWREDIRISAARFALFIRKLSETLKTLHTLKNKGVSVVTHSMGCCVVIYAIGRYPTLFAEAEASGVLSRIEMITPAFRGALGPMRLIDSGVSESPLDMLVSNHSVLRDTANTTASGFQMIVAPKSCWEDGLRLLQLHWDPLNHGSRLGALAAGDYRPRRPDEIPYPIRHNVPPDEQMVALSNWYEYPGVLAQETIKPWLVAGCDSFHREMQYFIHAIEAGTLPLISKMQVWCGLNGKSSMYVLYDHKRQVSVYQESGSAAFTHPGLLWNGDGCLVLQTNVLPPNVKHLAILPSHWYSHSKYHRDVLLTDVVIDALKRSILGQSPITLQEGDVKDGVVPAGPAVAELRTVLPFVDWSHECRAHAWNRENLEAHTSGRFRMAIVYDVPPIVPNLYDSYLQKHLSVSVESPKKVSWRNRGLCCDLLQMAMMRRMIVPLWSSSAEDWKRLSHVFCGRDGWWGSQRPVTYSLLTPCGKKECSPWWFLSSHSAESKLSVCEAVRKKQIQWCSAIQLKGEKLYHDAQTCARLWKGVLVRPAIRRSDMKEIMKQCDVMGLRVEEFAWVVQMASQYSVPEHVSIDLNS